MRPTDCRRFKRSCGETERDAPATNDPPRSGAPGRQCGAVLLVVVVLEVVRSVGDLRSCVALMKRPRRPCELHRGREAVRVFEHASGEW